MRFHLKSLVLWPRSDTRGPRILSFEEGALNVITGASKTGKSAVIPIIDYCLGSERCAVPVETIRDACAWFGLVVVTSEGEKLLARREPGQQQSTGDMFLIEAPSVSIPQSIPQKNTTVESVKQMLDRLAGLSNLGFDPSGVGGGFRGRPSFRDLLAFTFQPQNIVANPDVLYFKADTLEHREKLRTIFPYVLGAITPDLLAARWEVDHLERDVQRKERELQTLRSASAQWRSSLQGWVSEARNLGLLGDGLVVSEDPEALISALEDVVTRTSADIQVTDTALNASVDELLSIDHEEGAVSGELVEVKARLENMTQLRSAVDEYTGALRSQRDRLQLSRWLRDLAQAHEAECPVCGGTMDGAARELDVLVDALAAIEADARQLDPVPAAFDKELVTVRQQLRGLTDRFRAVQERRVAIESRSQRLRDERWRRASVDRFIGRMEQALEVFRAPPESSALAADVAELRARLDELRGRLSENAVRERQGAALQRVSAYIGRVLPALDNERPEDPAELSVDELTIRIVSADGRRDYLWEIGSGANWLSYHVAAMLGLQALFASHPDSPVPNFLVLDQPSQVYFPRKLAGPSAPDQDIILADEDVDAVRKVFAVLSEAASGGITGLQALVLDHAGSSVWEGLANVHLVEEWRDGKALVPQEWLVADEQ